MPECESRNRSRTDLVPPLNPFLALPRVTGYANASPASAAHQRVRTQHLHVISALERCRIRHGTLAHTSSHLTDRVILVIFKPAAQFFEHAMYVANSVCQNCRCHHCGSSAGHDRFEHIFCFVDTASDSKARIHLAVKNRGPMHPQKQFIATAQLEPRDYL